MVTLPIRLSTAFSAPFPRILTGTYDAKNQLQVIDASQMTRPKLPMVRSLPTASPSAPAACPRARRRSERNLREEGRLPPWRPRAPP